MNMFRRADGRLMCAIPTPSDDLHDIQSMRAEALALAERIAKWAAPRSMSRAGEHASDAAKGLMDWCSDDIWHAECAAIDSQPRAAAE